MAYLFEGKQFETYPDEALKAELLATISVSSQGWTDLAEVKRAGGKWVKAKRQSRLSCGMYS